MALRFLTALLFICLLTACAMADEAPRVIINLHGDRVEYSGDLNTVAITGQVRITAQSEKPGAPTVSMTADQVEANLASGIIIAQGGVKLLSQQAALKGETARINVKKDEFVLEHGAASADMPSAQYPGQTVRGFFTGDKLAREGQVLFVIEGRITTCDRDHPHYSIGARKISYDMAQHEIRVERGNVSLYGYRASLPANVTLPYGGGTSSGGLVLPIPQLSSYDGLYVRLTRHLEWDSIPWAADAWVNVGTALRLPAGLQISNQDEKGLFTAVVSRRDQAVWDFRSRSRIDRVPELSYLRHLQPVGNDLSKLDAEVFAGHIYEHVENESLIEASRLGLALHYSPMPRVRRDKTGWWAGADLFGTVYDTGDQLTDLRVETGTGWRLSKSVGGAVWGIHHFTSGQSPFRFDDVYSENEGFASLDLQVNEENRLQLYGHYDFDRSAFRDYSARYSYRAHCLTWNAEYNFARQAFTIGVDINGLTGDTRPLQAAPLVPSDEVPPLPAPVPAAPETAAKAHRQPPPPPVPVATPIPAPNTP